MKYLAGFVVALDAGSEPRSLWNMTPWEEARSWERLDSVVQLLWSKGEAKVERALERGGRGWEG